jgi:hypothetical protein
MFFNDKDRWMACQLCKCLVASAFFAARTVTSWIVSPTVRKPLNAVQAVSASCSNYHCQHVRHIHYQTLLDANLIQPILTAAGLQLTRHLVYQPRLVCLMHYHGRQKIPLHLFLNTSTSGTPTAGVTTHDTLCTKHFWLRRSNRWG